MHLLIATAVPPERDAVARAFGAGTTEVRLPGATLLRTAQDPVQNPSQDPAPVPADAPAVVVDVAAVGVGPAAAAAGTASALTAAGLAGTPYDLVVCAGIGGGFTGAAPVGSVVVSDAIVVADLGAQTPDGFAPVTELGFGTVTHTAPRPLLDAAVRTAGLIPGTVLTVSTVTGTAERTAELLARHPGAVAEGMEGFGVAEAAAAHGCPVLEIRAISNAVGPRDRAAWRIPEALAALTTTFTALGPVWAGAAPVR